MTQYIAVKKETTEREMFSIAAVDRGEVADCIEDVFPSFERVMPLVRLLQENAVPVEHFHDVVEDYILAEQ
ncbi:DUF6514 family protein [Agathobaculum sp.]|uniref:DUF6514 family protein n=1 Tax=Agathobaculum sp. TaxID=2048138 RepID=UPI002A81BCD0|nr:DUF6514 family protein [Agathobaculum sp.]MDY3618824.1 DUF6514 family protein [Agathobaculum sp.]